MKILVIEDDREAARYLEKAFAEAGHSADIAGDGETGYALAELKGHTNIILSVAFSPDGSKLASASPEGIVRVWALALDDLIAIAKSNVTRGLTAAECRQYVRAAECG